MNTSLWVGFGYKKTHPELDLLPFLGRNSGDKGEKKKKVYSKTYGINTNKCIYRPRSQECSQPLVFIQQRCCPSKDHVRMYSSLLIVETISGIPQKPRSHRPNLQFLCRQQLTYLPSQGIETSYRSLTLLQFPRDQSLNILGQGAFTQPQDAASCLIRLNFCTSYFKI